MPTSASGLGYTPVLAGDSNTVFFMDQAHRAFALRATDGGVVWSRATPLAAHIYLQDRLVAAHGVLVAASADVWGFDVASGATRWHFAPPDSGVVQGSPATDGVRVYASDLRVARVFALDATSGASVWTSAQLDSGETGAYGIEVYAGTVYVCSRVFSTRPRTGALVALDALTGSENWRYVHHADQSQQDEACLGHPTFVDGLIAQGFDDGKIVALDTAGGAVRWTSPGVQALPLPANQYTGSWDDDRLTGTNGSILVATSANTGILVGLDPKTGRELWRHTSFAGMAFSAPVVGNHDAYVSYGGAYAAFDPETGALLWRDPPGMSGNTDYFTAPALSRDRAFIAGQRAMYALER